MFQLDLNTLDADEMRAILRQMHPTNVLAHAMLAVGQAAAQAPAPADPVVGADPAQVPLFDGKAVDTAGMTPTAPAEPGKLTLDQGGQAPKRGRPKKTAPVVVVPDVAKQGEAVLALMQPVNVPKPEPEVGTLVPETGPVAKKDAAAVLAAPTGQTTPRQAAEAFVALHGTAALLAKLQEFKVRRVGEVAPEQADAFIALLREGLPA
jgi:hypothetical protein